MRARCILLSLILGGNLATIQTGLGQSVWDVSVGASWSLGSDRP